MDKAVLFCLLILPGICYTSADSDVDVAATQSSEGAGTLYTSPYTTVASTLGIADSTSDSWLDLNPATTVQDLTTTATEATCNTKADSAEEKSSETDDLDGLENNDGECEQNPSPMEIQKFSKAMMAFSIDLLKQADPQQTKPNVVMSPFSVALALLQLSIGAGKETEKKLLETLHMQSMKCLHNTLSKVQNDLTKTVMRIANRLYVKKGFQIKQSFLKRVENWYGSKALNLAKGKEENLKSINKWVSDATEGMIPTFLSDIPANMVLMLLNAMYFKGIWRNKFDPSMTIQDTFYVNDELSVPVDMMTAQKYPLRWFMHEQIDSQVAKLSFKGNMSFIVIMPLHFQWNLSKILDNFNQTEIYHRFTKEKHTFLRMPKLSLDFKLDLSQALSSLGLGHLFTNPDLSGISDEPLFVSSVQHQSSLKLNEEGAEASAATAIITSRSLASYSINRPFLFIIIDDSTGLPLFLGYVRNPNPGYFYKEKEFRFKDKPDKGSIPK
ncbi:alpha-2-antiplasmin [Pelodytes ibericus]